MNGLAWKLFIVGNAWWHARGGGSPRSRLLRWRNLRTIARKAITVSEIENPDALMYMVQTWMQRENHIFVSQDTYIHVGKGNYISFVLFHQATTGIDSLQ
jgi:hypothetical protein